MLIKHDIHQNERVPYAVEIKLFLIRRQGTHLSTYGYTALMTIQNDVNDLTQEDFSFLATICVAQIFSRLNT